MIIGLMGSNGVGKTTCANYLAREHGFKIRQFSLPAKEAAAALLGEPLAFFEEHDFKDLTPVSLLFKKTRRQLVGNICDYMLEINPDFFTQGIAIDPDSDYVFTDVRTSYPKGISWIQKNGGRLIHIIRPGCEEPKYEELWDEFQNFIPDHTISNYGEEEFMIGQLKVYLGL